MNKLSSLSMNILNMDESSTWNSERVMITQLAHLIQTDVPQVPFMKALKFDPNKHSPNCINNFKLLIQSSDSLHLSDFRLASARLARKQLNFNLASRLIIEQLDLMQSRPTVATTTSETNFDTIKHLLEENNYLFQKSNQQNRILLLESELETAKLLYELSINDKSKLLDSISILVNSIVRYSSSDDLQIKTNNPIVHNQLFINPIQTNNSNILIKNDQINEMCSKSILTLFKWFKRSDSSLLKDINTQFELLTNRSYDYEATKAITETIADNLSKIIDSKKKYSETKNLNFKNDLKLNTNTNEMILGDLLDLSTLVSPKLAKAWYTMANWCYKWGKKNADKIQLNFNKSSTQAIIDDEKTILLDLLPTHASNEEKEFVISLFLRGATNSIKLNNSNENEICLNQQTEINNDKFAQEVRSLLNENCQSLSAECIESLIDTWRHLANKVYYFHRIASKAYFTYLNLSAQSSQNEGNISATLRILKILIKYATELKDDLQKGLAKTPTQPWLLTIPQLFCRLNHPEAYVRQSISELLCRIARDFPHLIIYPAVVGSQDGPTKIENVHKSSNNKNAYPKLSQQKDETNSGGDIETVDEYDEDEIKQDDDSNEIVEPKEEEEEEEEEEDEEEIANEEKQVELKNSYKCLLDTLAETNPKMIDEVKLFVHEMRRVTLLREELWLGTLNQIRKFQI